MTARQVWAVFIKDGRELIRDRRTLLVNVALPVLLYPLLLLVLVQVQQLTRATNDEAVRVAYDEHLPPELGRRFAQAWAGSMARRPPTRSRHMLILCKLLMHVSAVAEANGTTSPLEPTDGFRPVGKPRFSDAFCNAYQPSIGSFGKARLSMLTHRRLL